MTEKSLTNVVTVASSEAYCWPRICLLAPWLCLFLLNPMNTIHRTGYYRYLLVSKTNYTLLMGTCFLVIFEGLKSRDRNMHDQTEFDILVNMTCIFFHRFIPNQCPGGNRGQWGFGLVGLPVRITEGKEGSCGPCEGISCGGGSRRNRQYTSEEGLL